MAKMRISSLVVLGGFYVACGNPAADKPKAEVTEALEEAKAPLEAEKIETRARTIALNGENTKIGFVGAKVTGIHEGTFETLSGKVIYTGTDPTAAKIEVSIDVASVKSDSEKLDGHLKSADFFDVEKFPKGTFTSNAIVEGGTDGNTHTVSGTLDLHGIKKQISFPAKFEISPSSAKVSSEFSINRKDFGIVYPGMPDDLIRDDVVIKIEINAGLSS